MRKSCLLLAALAAATAAACGEVSGFIDAAPGDDDTIDASTVDAEPELGAVNVVTHALCCTPPSGLLEGVSIFVVHPDGTLGDTATSNASGEATVDVLPGSAVSAVYPRNPGGTIQTFAAVVPGDSLTFGSNWVDSSKVPTTGSITVNWAAQSGVSYFYVYGACSYYYVDGLGTTVTESLYASCGAGPSTFVVIGHDSNGNVLRYGVIPSVPHSTGTVNVPSFQAPTAFSMSVTGLPAEVTNTYLYNEGYAGDQYLGGFGGYVVPSGGTVSHTRPWPTAAIDSVYSQVEVYRDGPYNSQYQYERTPGSSPRTLSNLEWLPWMSEVIYSGATRELLWLQAGESPYDQTIVQAYWTRGSGGSGVFGGSGGGGESYDWTLVLPAGVTRVALPEAPAALEAFLPTSDDNVNLYVQIGDSAAIDSYREIVALPFWFQYGLGDYASTTLPRIRRSSSSSGGGAARLLPRHGFANQLEPASHR